MAYSAVRQMEYLPVRVRIEFRKAATRAELAAGHQPLGKFDMIADIKKLDRIAVILGEFEKPVRARGEDPTAEFESLRDRSGGRLADFEIGKNHRVAYRHPGQKIGFGLRAHEVNTVGQILRVSSKQLRETAIGLDDQSRCTLSGNAAELVAECGVHETLLEQLADIGMPRH